jgi:hypothetical protein
MRGGEEPPMEELKNWMYEKIETNVAGSVLESTSPELSQIEALYASTCAQQRKEAPYTREESAYGGHYRGLCVLEGMVEDTILC